MDDRKDEEGTVSVGLTDSDDIDVRVVDTSTADERELVVLVDSERTGEETEDDVASDDVNILVEVVTGSTTEVVNTEDVAGTDTDVDGDTLEDGAITEDEDGGVMGCSQTVFLRYDNPSTNLTSAPPLPTV